METKICFRCKKEKPISDYAFRKERNAYRGTCKKCQNEMSKRYRKKHKDTWKKYYKNNYKHRLELNEKYRLKRKENDNVYKFSLQIRNLVRISFNKKKFIKNNNCKSIIGCDFDYFYNYLLKTFKDNYGYEWDKKEPVHIDHIIPLATAKTEEEVIKLCHYTNLQLLKPKDNLAKSNKLDWRI